jgi:hypothetical protein
MRCVNGNNNSSVLALTGPPNRYCVACNDIDLVGRSCFLLSFFSRKKALKRILGLPFDCHSYLLPYISNTFPIFDEICKRAARFIIPCLSSPNKLVFSVARYCVTCARYGSIVGSNALFCCERYQWSYDQFDQNADVCYFSNSILKRQFIKNWTDSELRNAEFLLELLYIREGYSALPFEFLNSVQLNDIIADVATN